MFHDMSLGLRVQRVTLLTRVSPPPEHTLDSGDSHSNRTFKDDIRIGASRPASVLLSLGHVPTMHCREPLFWPLPFSVHVRLYASAETTTVVTYRVWQLNPVRNGLSATMTPLKHQTFTLCDRWCG